MGSAIPSTEHKKEPSESSNLASNNELKKIIAPPSSDNDEQRIPVPNEKATMENQASNDRQQNAHDSYHEECDAATHSGREDKSTADYTMEKHAGAEIDTHENDTTKGSSLGESIKIILLEETCGGSSDAKVCISQQHPPGAVRVSSSVGRQPSNAPIMRRKRNDIPAPLAICQRTNRLSLRQALKPESFRKTMDELQKSLKERARKFVSTKRLRDCFPNRSPRVYAIEYAKPRGGSDRRRKTVCQDSQKSRLRWYWIRRGLNYLHDDAIRQQKRHGESRYSSGRGYSRKRIKLKARKSQSLQRKRKSPSTLKAEKRHESCNWNYKNTALEIKDLDNNLTPNEFGLIQARPDHSKQDTKRSPLGAMLNTGLDVVQVGPTLKEAGTLRNLEAKNTERIWHRKLRNSLSLGISTTRSLASTSFAGWHLAVSWIIDIASALLHLPWRVVEWRPRFSVVKRTGKGAKTKVYSFRKKWATEGIRFLNLRDFSVHDYGVVEDYIEEHSQPDLLAPPTRFQTVEQRQRSIQRSQNSRLPARNLAENGFFLNDRDLLQCYSCFASQPIEEVLKSPSAETWHASGCERRSRHGCSNSTQKRLRDVESDCPPGQISDVMRDPPGQQSIYIPPGDVRNESYRLSTFEHFPVICPISKKSLAKCGFYFTGFFDRVKCFACGRTVERWEAHDSPAQLKWHKDTCPFPRGVDCDNVPIASIFHRILGNTSTRPISRNPGEEVLEQRDPVTGAVTRTVRFPSDLPDRIRQSGGTFEILPNNTINIQSGPGTTSNRQPGLQQAVQSAQRRLTPSAAMQAHHRPMRQWRMANVVSADVRRFLTNLFLNRELDRLTSFARWPTGRPNVSPAALAKSGFFYLGDMDRTQCFSCGGVLRNWNAEDNAEAEHRVHFPNCKFVLGEEPRNVPVPLLPDSPEERAQNFPCRFPCNPHMRSEAARLETFDQRWPLGRTAATPAEIAQAGFFFLGERDRAKCWYCNGGLQHWEYDDMPWIEHAKWFPNCQFLLKVKGQHFVYRHLSINPHLARPIIARQDGARIDPAGAPGSFGEPPQDIPPNAMDVRAPSPPPMIIDPQEEMRKKRERVENVMKNSEIVKNVLTMGFSERIVRMLLQEKIDSETEENPADIYGTVTGLLDDVMKKEEELRQEEQQQNQASGATAMPLLPTTSMSSYPSEYSAMSTNTNLSSIGPSPGSGKYHVSYFGDDDEDRDMYGSEAMGAENSLNSVTLAKQIQAAEGTTESLQEALTKIEEERMCKICFNKPADMVFVPCGHMCCCMECTQAIRQCPLCRVKIEKAIKTYLS